MSKPPASQNKVPDSEPDADTTGSSWIRPVLTLVVLAGLAYAAHRTGLRDLVNAEWIRATVESAGVWGVLAYTGVFAIGELLHVPGLVFVGAAALAYDGVLGVGVALLGATVSVTFSFVVVRRAGGQPFQGLESSLARRLLDHLDERPIATVAVLRLLLWMAPALNYGLAMTGVRLRDYVAGSVLGLVVPVTVSVLVFEGIFASM